MLDFLKSRDLKLWGATKPISFLSQVLTFSLYHHLSGTGFCALEKATGLSSVPSAKSLLHNCDAVFQALEEWSNSHIIPGDQAAWRAAARHSGFPKSVSSVTLLVDSSDFPLQRRKGKRGRKSSHWSWKLNRPGRRFTAIVDVKGRFRYLSNGYTPKLHDGHFLTARQQELEQVFAGGVIAADSHYAPGRKFKRVKFFVPTRERHPRESDENVSTQELAVAERKLNEEIRTARARVEQVFASIKNDWATLREPWAGNKDQLSYAVRVAAAVHNSKL